MGFWKKVGAFLALIGAGFLMVWNLWRSEKDEVRQLEATRAAQPAKAQQHADKRETHERRSREAEDRARQAVQRIKGKSDDDSSSDGDADSWYDRMQRDRD